MTEENNSIKDTGELKFEFITNDSSDSDRKFTSSIKNLLVLVKDFYGADDALVYWFNKNKQSFKLLASSEDNWKDVLNDRFEVGSDPVSRICLKKSTEIINFESEQDRQSVRHYKGYFNIRSMIANPLLLDNECVAVVLCESKTLNFFGTPNLYTLQVFSESITNYVKYYSLHEDFEYQDGVLSMIASGKLQIDSSAFDLIEKSFSRYVDYSKLALITYRDRGFVISKSYSNDGSTDGISGKSIENGSLAMRSIQSGKVLTHFFDRNSTDEYRFFKNEEPGKEVFFCIVPVLVKDFCLGAMAFETDENVYGLQKELSKIYKLVLPQFLYLRNIESISHSQPDIIDRETGFYNRSFFETRLASEISRCRLFDDTSLYCVVITIDNISQYSGSPGIGEVLFKSLADALKEKFMAYDMLFKIEQGKFAVLLNLGSDEKVFLEFEKLRKYISSKIYNIEGREVSYTISCGIKKYDDLNCTQEDFLNEIDNLILLAVNEGGNSVKI